MERRNITSLLPKIDPYSIEVGKNFVKGCLLSTIVVGDNRVNIKSTTLVKLFSLVRFSFHTLREVLGVTTYEELTR